MRFWQYRASKYSKRLAHRLKKFNHGQLLLEHAGGETFRGQIKEFRLSEGGKIEFDLHWRASKVIISKSLWLPKWKWELAKWDWHKDSSSIPILACAVDVEVKTGNEHGHLEDLPADALKVELRKFHQNKAGKKGKTVYPKCLFFTTTLGEKGTLFQPHDPRNLTVEDGEVVDPFAPPLKEN